MRTLRLPALLCCGVALAGCNMGSGGRGTVASTVAPVVSVATGTTVSIAGMYSASYSATINGTAVTTQDYVYIAPNGLVNVFLSQDDGTVTPGRNCYLLATGQQIDAPLQNLVLASGSAPTGASDIQVTLSNGDTFGIILPNATTAAQALSWFVTPAQGTTVYAQGGNQVQTVDGYRYVFGGTNLTTPTLTELQAATCT